LVEIIPLLLLPLLATAVHMLVKKSKMATLPLLCCHNDGIAPGVRYEFNWNGPKYMHLSEKHAPRGVVV
jgi:hypothetical protein